MTLVPVFPPELEREIFETAALMHPKTIPVLLRVAHRVLIWIEPVLYRVIRIDHLPVLPMADAVRRAMEAKSASFFEESVRHLLLAPIPNWSDEDVCTLLRLCPRLVSFAISKGCFSRPPSLSILQGMHEVRNWSGSLEDLFGSHTTIDLGHPFFRTVTHMDIFEVVHDDDIRICPGLAALPALTHLCLNGGTGAGAVRRVLEQCMHLRVLVNMWHKSDNEGAYEIASNPPVTDVRFVVSMFSDYWKDWEVGARGGIDFWAAADMFVARKRRGEIELTCYLLEHI
ncbi:hypothetical protein C8R44DRAFT_892752 [Mycena epipterygia]|nr:hypothetical protein C8R44DRAFT_892752 [Mycena epipterygia]